MAFTPDASEMFGQIKPSGIRKMFQRAAGLEGVISLGIGAPDLQPPEALLSILSEMLSKRTHSYVLNDGIPKIHSKIKEQYTREWGIDTNDTQVVVGAGATQVMYGAFFAYTNPGDEVIVPDPGFVYYPTIPIMAGCKVHSVPLDDAFQMDPDSIQNKVTKKTKLIVVNSPGNPTGVVQTETTLKAIADIAIDNNIIVLSDEVYEFMTFDHHKHVPMMKLAPDNTITLNSFSKTYCVPGWRLGYAIGTPEIMAPLSQIHPYIVANAPSLFQHAIADFMGTEDDIQFRKKLGNIMETRRDVVKKAFSNIPGLELPEISGSFYAFPRVTEEKYSGSNPGLKFSEDMFEKAKVVTVAASEFGETRLDHFRLSFGSADIPQIKEAAERIRNQISA